MLFENIILLQHISMYLILLDDMVIVYEKRFLFVINYLYMCVKLIRTIFWMGGKHSVKEREREKDEEHVKSTNIYVSLDRNSKRITLNGSTIISLVVDSKKRDVTWCC